ncbi:hypothetical protein C8R48DRAFT_323280 [Suillus tomentosus]|nr:hypothetical protein C8R48DRAFT_323280 [Suillus tomentosus]
MESYNTLIVGLLFLVTRLLIRLVVGHSAFTYRKSLLRRGCLCSPALLREPPHWIFSSGPPFPSAVLHPYPGSCDQIDVPRADLKRNKNKVSGFDWRDDVDLILGWVLITVCSSGTYNLVSFCFRQSTLAT